MNEKGGESRPFACAVGRQAAFGGISRREACSTSRKGRPQVRSVIDSERKQVAIGALDDGGGSVAMFRAWSSLSRSRKASRQVLGRLVSLVVRRASRSQRRVGAQLARWRVVELVIGFGRGGGSCPKAAAVMSSSPRYRRGALPRTQRIATKSPLP